MTINQVDYSGELGNILCRLNTAKIDLECRVNSLDVPMEEMPPEARVELAETVDMLKRYLSQLAILREKLETLRAEVEMYEDMHRMPEIYGPPEFFGI